LEELRLCLPQQLRRVLKELPSALDETYVRVLKGIAEDKRSQARRLFQCLAVAIRPLRVEELGEFLAFDFDEVREGIPKLKAGWRLDDPEAGVLSACSSLVAVVPDHVSEAHAVQFAHFSVKEFLTSDRLASSHDPISRFHIPLPLAHTTIAQVSLGVLLQVNNDGRVQNRSPLAEYAARYWVDHARFGKVSSHLILRLFDPSEPYFTRWLQLHDIDDGWDQSTDYSKTEPRGTPLYYASLCGFHDLAAHLIAEHPDYVNTIGGLNHTPLAAALHRRHFDIAELLLEHGATMDVKGYERRSLLHAASAGGLADVVRWLLDHGADPDSVQVGRSTPLCIAAANGHLGVVLLLLERGANLNAANAVGQTPLHQASEDGHLETSRLLLSRGANVNAKDWSHSTPLHLASSGGSADIARLLIHRGADINAQSKGHSTPLHLASSRGQTEIVRLLIDRGADVHVRDGNQSTPLHLASSAGSIEIVRLLITHGADVDAKDEEGQTPYQIARSGRHPNHEIIAQLLSESA
jgi:ankyrin repeat protein